MENDREMGFFPMFVDIREKKCVVIGGGTIAGRRIQTLTGFCRHIEVVAKTAGDPVKELAKEGKIILKERPYEREDLYGADLVLAATDDKKLNDEIYSVCKCLGVLVNVCSDQHKCDFQFPGVVCEEDVVIGINAAGKDHHKVKVIRECIEEAFENRRNDE